MAGVKTRGGVGEWEHEDMSHLEATGITKSFQGPGGSEQGGRRKPGRQEVRQGKSGDEQDGLSSLPHYFLWIFHFNPKPVEKGAPKFFPMLFLAFSINATH